MMSVSTVDLDLIEELRLRRWARENYVPRGQRQTGWHSVVLDEMSKKDFEGAVGESSAAQTSWLKS
ncbi:MAG TPA: hypothetical protein VGP68_13165 [Gemmataceae bacterium]|jgi:hypothetical protein|nr:hypothetical protein [Gemmataceae bacterium]